MVKVSIRNESKYVIRLQDGNGGVFATRATIKPYESYMLKLDPNATYREYRFTTVGGDTLVLSSDDFFEFGKVILKDTDGRSRITWEGISRESKHKMDTVSSNVERGESEPKKDDSSGPEARKSEASSKHKPSKFTKFLKLLWNGNSSLK